MQERCENGRVYVKKIAETKFNVNFHWLLSYANCKIHKKNVSYANLLFSYPKYKWWHQSWWKKASCHKETN